ncbi:MAG: S8 family serine peptidase [Ekhidna sp.]|nr:S8 family serine peptidase [Ekhidna sp.]
MKIKFYILAFLLLFGFSLMGQKKNYYYYNNQKIYINIDREFISINSASNLNFLNNYSTNYISKTEFIENKCRSYAIPTDKKAQNRVNLKNYYSEVKVKNTIKSSVSNYTNFINLLNKNSNTTKVSPCFRTVSGERLGLTNNFYVKIGSVSDVTTLYNYAKTNNLEIIGKDPYMPNWYILCCTKNNTKNSLEYANQFHESGLFITAEPEFIYHDLETTNDSFYSSQWGLKNTGQYNSSHSDIDVNAEQAWKITRGDKIKVAIYDHGFEMNHPDLASNTFGNGFDATTGTSPSQVRGSHGTACAGIIGAVQNNKLGVSGIAPSSSIVSISINLFFSDTPAQLASGFSWAWQNGVEVISNSWGGYAPSGIITDAIDNALTKGRNGKGCIVVFASGNENNTNIRYPGSAVPEVLVVGAISPCGERKNPNSCDGEAWGSNYGNSLDVVAPGVLIPTTDRQGNNGYNTGLRLHPLLGGKLVSSDFSDKNYTVWFNGTSAACPHVAGVAALILSVNPTLTAKEVNAIIESTAQKVGGYSYTNTLNRPNGTWNNEMGYGLVDAHAAVQKAQQLCEAKLGSVSAVRYNECKTINLSNSCNSSVTWTASSHVTIVSKSNSKVTIRGKSCTSGSGWVKATLRNGKVLTDTFKYVTLPVIKFGDTSLTGELLALGGLHSPFVVTTVNYPAVTIREGDRIPLNV